MYNNKKIIVTLLATAILAGCQTTNPYTNETQTSKSTMYGLIGAASGALVGGLTNGGKGALVGGLLGGAAGTGAGYYQDQQEAKLRQHLQSTGVSVVRDGEQLYLVLPGRLSFDSGSSDVKSGLYPVLGSVAEVLKEFEKTDVSVVGYTDSTGSPSENELLSQKRAGSVADYLAFQGVSAERLNAYGRGPENPVANNDSKEGRAQNRRVEIHLQPQG